MSLLVSLIYVSSLDFSLFSCLYSLFYILATFQEAVIAHSLYKAILEIVKRHIANEILIEVALEIFIILSLNGMC